MAVRITPSSRRYGSHNASLCFEECGVLGRGKGVQVRKKTQCGRVGLGVHEDCVSKKETQHTLCVYTRATHQHTYRHHPSNLLVECWLCEDVCVGCCHCHRVQGVVLTSKVHLRGGESVGVTGSGWGAVFELGYVGLSVLVDRRRALACQQS